MAGMEPAPLPLSASAPKRPARLIVLHCSATPNDRALFSGTAGKPGFRTPAMEIDAWHRERGFHRDTYWRGRQEAELTAIGYHFVVARNGAVFGGRHLDETGAHAAGWNSASVGICLVGTDRFTVEQWDALAACVRGLARDYAIPLAPPVLVVQGQRGRVARPGVCGHRDLPGHRKQCPGFDVSAWLAGDLQPLTEHLA